MYRYKFQMMILFKHVVSEAKHVSIHVSVKDEKLLYQQVRDAAINALVEIYRHVGEKVRQDIIKKDINRQK